MTRAAVNKNGEQWYLVIKNIYFVDPHGTPDDGGVEKYTSNDPVYGVLDQDALYQDDMESYHNWDDVNGSLEENLKEAEVNQDEMSAEDGYNMEVFGYSVTKITEDQAKEYQSTIDAYDKIV